MKKVICLFLSFCLLNCGSDKGQKQIDPMEEAKNNDQKLTDKWNLFANTLGILNNDFKLTGKETSKEVKKKIADNLGTATTLMSNDLEKSKKTHEEEIKQIAEIWLKEKKKIEVKELVAFAPFPTPNAIDKEGEELNAQIYVLQYRVFVDKEGEKFENRHALMVVPNDKTKIKGMIAYAHGNDMGIWPSQIGRDLDKKQEEYVIIAPSFPGEPICSTDYLGVKRKACSTNEVVYPAEGKSSPWENDVDDFLAITSYLTDFSTQTDDVSQKIKNITGQDKFNRTHVFGVSRGGLVASLSLAKNILIKASNAIKFKSLTLLSSPMTILHGKFRFLLEYTVKGMLEYTEYVDKLPCMRTLKDLYKDFRLAAKGTKEEETELEKAKINTLKRDILFLLPSYLGYKANLPKINILYHKKDKVIPYCQGQAVVMGIESIKQSNPGATPLIEAKVKSYVFDSDEGKDVFHLTPGFWTAKNPANQTPYDVINSLY